MIFSTVLYDVIFSEYFHYNNGSEILNFFLVLAHSGYVFFRERA